MKKRLKKFGAIMLATVCGLSTFAVVGCAPDDGPQLNEKPSEEQLKNMSQLIIGVYDGGLGYAWAQAIAQEFSKYYANESLEPGKTGVYVDVWHAKEQYESGLADAVEVGTETGDMYYTAGTMAMWKDVSLDITDILTEKVYGDDGELAEEGPATKSILDRIDPYFATNMVTVTDEGTEEYHYLPTEDCINGFVYDYDLFEENGWLHYSGRDGTPKTTDEFIALLNEIDEAGYTAWTYSPEHTAGYLNALYLGFIGQYEGYDNAMLNMTLNGTYTFPAGTFDTATCEAEGVVVDPETKKQTVQITEANGWMLAYQPSKKELLEFISEISQKRFFPENLNGQTNTYTGAQESFVYGWGYDKGGQSGGERIAMIFEGEWWENEARESFNALAKRYPGRGLEYGKRDFRFMTIPRSTSENATNEAEYSFTIAREAFAFVNKFAVSKNSTKYDVLKKWIQFSLSETSLGIYSKYTSAVLPYEYTVKEEDMEGWTKFAKNVYELKRDPDVTIYRGQSTDKAASKYQTFDGTLKMSGFGGLRLTSTYQGSSQGDLVGQFYNYPDSLEGMYNGLFDRYSKDKWTTSYNTYLSYMSGQ